MIPITPLDRPAYPSAPAPIRVVIDGIVGVMLCQTNWMVRKKTLLDALDLTDDLLTRAGRATEASPGGEQEESGAGGVISASRMIPVIVGTVLEQLKEPAITSAEQAVLYTLSIHPEHRAAAEAWLDAGLKNAKAARKLSRCDPRLRALLKRLDAA